MKTDRNRIFLALALLIVVVVTVNWPRTSPPPVPAPEHPTEPAESLRIGSWNIEWLGQPNRRSGPAKGIRQSPEDLADYIAASGVRVLALQEVAANAADGSPTNAALNRACEILDSEHGGDWWHVVFPSSSSNQNAGVLWDAESVTLLNSPNGYAVPIDRITSAQDKRVWARPPRALHFSAGEGATDFVIIPIHMKSDYGGGFAVHRAEEAGVLAAALPRVASRFSDHDILVIGDTNSQSTSDESIQAFERAGLLDLNDSDAVTYWRGSSLDRILVPADQPEFASPGFGVFFDRYTRARGLDETDFKERWSDHWMVVFTLDVMADDD